MTKRWVAFVTLFVLAYSVPVFSTAKSDDTRVASVGLFAAALETTRQSLLQDPYAYSDAQAEKTTNDFIAGLVNAAWQLAHTARHLQVPQFSVAREVIGRPGLYNPDNIYRSALLEPDGEYRISGVRGDHTQLTFQFVDSYPLIGLNRDLLVIDLGRHGVNPGDAFEFYIGGQQRKGLWWPMPAKAQAVLTRQTFSDWSKSASPVHIERLDKHWPAIDPQNRLALAADYLQQMTGLWVDHYLAGLKKLPLNSLSALRASTEEAGGLSGQQTVMGRYQLRPGQALLISVRASDADYQSIQLGNHWFVTPDPVDHQVSLNLEQAHINSDGIVRYVISLEDPKVANWLDPAGNPEGYIFMRWQGIQTPLTRSDQATVEPILLTEVMPNHPVATRPFTLLQREEQLNRRVSLPAWK